jgi:hypothetical protein
MNSEGDHRGPCRIYRHGQRSFRHGHKAYRH